MKKKLALVVGLLCCSILTGTAFAASNDVKGIVAPKQDTRQVYKVEKMIQVNENNVSKGRGTLHGTMAFVREDATEDDAIKEIGTRLLNRGDYIGVHTLNSEEEAYIIISGTGLYTNSKTETIVTKGDVAMARVGQSHGLRNIGYDPLVFITVIAKNEGNAAVWIDTSGEYSHIREFRGEVALQREAERQAEVQRAEAQIKQDAIDKKLAEKKARKEAKERARQEKKAREEAARQAKKNKMPVADNVSNTVVTPANAADKKNKNDSEKKNRNSQQDKDRNSQLREAQAEEAVWEAKQKAKISEANQNSSGDFFAI